MKDKKASPYLAYEKFESFQRVKWILTVCCYCVTYAFHSESKLYSCLNVKKFLAQNRCDISSWSDSNSYNNIQYYNIITYSEMHHIDNSSQHSSIIWPVWLNGWVFVCELCNCGFESRCSHLSFWFRAFFEEGVRWR